MKHFSAAIGMEINGEKSNEGRVDGSVYAA